MINIIFQIIPIMSFIMGFYLGYSIKKDERLPEIKSPSRIIKEKKEEKKQEHNKQVLDAYLENLDNYPYNQKDIKE